MYLNCIDSQSTHFIPTPLTLTPTLTPSPNNLPGFEHLKTDSVVSERLLATLLTPKKCNSVLLIKKKKKKMQTLIRKKNEHSEKLRAYVG